MRREWTIFKFHKVEMKITEIRPNETVYIIPQFYHNKVCIWYDIYGMKFYKRIYYIVISHINK